MTYGSPVPVVLRELTPADAGPLEELLCDPVVMEFGDLRTPDGCVAFVEDAMAMYDEYGLGPFAVCLDDDPALLGYCALRKGRDWIADHQVELGYRLVRRAWGHGIATDAARIACARAFDEHHADEVFAAIDPNNDPSIRVAERLGMTRTGEIMFPDYDYPDLVYTVTAAEWRSLSR